MAKEKKLPAEKKHGVTITAWKGHPVYRWRVSFPDGGKRRAKGFKTKSGIGGAQEFADEKRGTVKEEGSRNEDINPEERQAMISFRQLVKDSPLPDGKPTLADAVKFYADHLSAIPSELSAKDKADIMRKAPESFRDRLSLSARSLSFDALKKELLDRLEKSGRSEAHQKDMKQRLGVFSNQYGDWLACDISEEIVSEWLLTLPHAAQTQKHYGRALFSLFQHAIRRNAIEKNPVDLTILPEVRRSAPEVFTANDAAGLLEHADEEILPALAIALFAGLRPASELVRLEWQDIDIEERFIRVHPNGKEKAGRIVTISENLAAWLSPLMKRSGRVCPTAQIWRNRRLKAMKAAGVSWPHDGTRHSFASYHLAFHKNLPLTSQEMGHTNPNTIRHYRNAVTPAEAKAFWTILPEHGGNVVNLKTA